MTFDPKSAAAPRWALPALLLGALAIAFAPLFVKLAPVGPVACAFWRVTLALPALALWAAQTRRKPQEQESATDRPAPSTESVGAAGARWTPLLWAGGCFAADLAVWHWSLRHTSVANATLLANFAPIFVALGVWLLWRKPPRGGFVAGMALALGGAVLLSGGAPGADPNTLWGDLLGLITALFYGGYQLAVSAARKSWPTPIVAGLSAALSAALLLPLALVTEPSLFPPTLEGWAPLVGLALISHAGGQSLIVAAMAHVPPAFSSVALLLQPAAAALLAWALLGEALGPLQAVGGVVVLAGVLLCRRHA